ncbi:hypothetical protein MMC07_006137 [Pseudocyphellaria aurata]|nr:hypothetical protein [Pseudocyphellaria aurata]
MSQQLTEESLQPIQQPKSLTRKRPYISFLTDTVDQPWSPRPKRYRPESVDRFVTQWVESVSGPESYRERHCRSDSLLNHPDGDFISRRLTQSVPNMVNNCDAEGSTVPTTPESAVSRSNLQSFEPSDAATSADVTSDAYTTKSKKHLVEDQSYRSVNLDLNNIFMRSKREEFPEHISDLINLVSRGRNSPEPSFDPEQEDELEELARGAPETEVQTYFHKWIFSGSKNLLHCSDRMPMANHAVPSTCKQHKVSNPKPDLLFGYKRNLALPQHRLLGPLSKEMTATSSNQAYPFLLIEFKADSPSGNGSLLVATNQCLGGAASCVNLVERLNDRLKACKDDENRPLNSAAFSVAMNGTEARLFISWKHDVNYYLQDVRGFLLSEADHYLLFRKYMRNILDWGKDDRLNQIRESLDKLLEENRKMATAISKSRSSPSDDESGRNSKAKRNA